MTINDSEKEKIMATKPPSFTMKKVLRPIANLIARYTSPSQVCSVLKDFGFKEIASNPMEVEALLLRIFETLRDENDYETIGKIIERFLALYASYTDDEKLQVHDKNFISPVREILRRGHFSMAFHKGRKEYVIAPFEGPAHGIVMRAEGATEDDFLDQKKTEMRTLGSPQRDPSDFYITKDKDDFKYQGAILKLGKNTQYFKVFSSLYTLLPDGGMAKYSDIGKEVIRRIPKKRNLSAKEMIKFIVDKLDEHNGFLRRTKINNVLSDGRELIHSVRGEGVEFNNRK